MPRAGCSARAGGGRNPRIPCRAEEYYQALKLRGIETALVRIPDSSHALADRPSQLISKVLHILEWFARHGGEPAVAK